MVDTSKVKQALATQTPQQTLQQLIEKSVKEFKRALPVHMRPERLVRIALTCIRQTPDLVKCNPASFVGALLVSAQLGLEPLAGRAYILPFWNNKANRLDAQFIMGYRGLSDLFYRHEKSVQFNWGVVHKNDEFEFEYGTQAKLRHKFGMSDRGEVIAYYVMAELQGGAKPFIVMSRNECIEHGKKHSKTFDAKTSKFYPTSPWNNESDAMCLKTCWIQLGKVLPLSIELQRAISADETSREYREGIDDALDIPAQEWNSEQADTPTILQNQPETTQGSTISSKASIDTTPEPEAPENTIKPMPKPLTIEEAQKVSIGETIRAVQGILSDYEVKTVTKKDKKTKVDITNYLILSEDNQFSITITKWGGLHEGLQLGDTIVFEDVVISEFNNTRKYLAQSVSLLQARKETE